MSREASHRSFRPQSPFLAWPPFFARPPFALPDMMHGLEVSQRESPATLSEGRRAQLRLLLEWAVQRVPHYRGHPSYADVLARIRRAPEALPDAWPDLPILTKGQLRSLRQGLNVASLPPGHGPPAETHTSGSTGIKVRVGTTSLTRAIWNALELREHLWHRRNFARRFGAIRFVATQERVPGGKDFPGWGLPVSELYNTGPASVIHIGYPMGELADWLRRFAPHYLLTYPSVAAALLDEFGDARPPALEEVRMMSEPLDPDLEERLKHRWGIRCTDIYSANEVGYIAFRCAEHGRLHVQAESLHVEVLDESGRACSAGETGRVVITPLHNLRTPLLRYEIGDYATVGAPCACGRTLPVLERVCGRVRNLVQTPDGRRYWPVSLGNVQQVSAIRQAQFVQVALDRVELRVVVERPLTEKERVAAADHARRALAYPFEVDVVAVDEIERGPTGKFEEFRSQLPEEQHSASGVPSTATR